MKAGIKTTEFWVAIAFVIVAGFKTLASPATAAAVAQHSNTAGDWSTTASLIAAGFAAGCYAISRGLSKNGQ